MGRKRRERKGTRKGAGDRRTGGQTEGRIRELRLVDDVPKASFIDEEAEAETWILSHIP